VTGLLTPGRCGAKARAVPATGWWRRAAPLLDFTLLLWPPVRAYLDVLADPSRGAGRSWPVGMVWGPTRPTCGSSRSY
jgi:hypothetical protein